MSNIKYIRKRLILEIPFDNEKTNYKNLNMNQKFEFINKLAKDNLKMISSKLKFDSIQYEKKTPFKNTFFFIIYTINNKNHPIIGYISKANTANVLYLIRPTGRRKFNISMEQIQVYLYAKNEINLLESYAVYLSIIKSIVTRKKELISDPNFSLLKCSNIINCNSKNEKESIQKAGEVLQEFFTHLENNKTKLASLMIKENGGTANQKLLTIFKNKKKIIGHLEIFIPLYELVGAVIYKFFELTNSWSGDYQKRKELKKQQTMKNTKSLMKTMKNRRK